MKRLTAVISKSLLVLSFLYPLTTLASTPTMEGLFRNGANAEMGGEVITLRVMFEEKSNDLLMERLKIEGNEAKLQEMLRLERMPTKYLELILVPEGSRNYDGLISEHSSRSFDSSLVRAEFYPGFTSRLKKDSNVSRNLLFATILMLGANESDPMVKLVKSYNKDFEYNRDVMNSDKIALLKRYQKYLAVTKDDRTMRAEMESPMNPTDETKKQYVHSVDKSRMYRISNNVKLIRENSLFFWLVSLERLQARFFNDTHQLDFLKMNVGEGQLEITSSDYILLEGRFRVPRYFMFKDLNDRLYKVSFVSIKTGAKNSFKMTERHEKMKTLIDRKLSAPVPAILY